MPLLRPRTGDSDGGYAVMDYRSIRPDLGTMDDLRSLAGALREAGISLVLDLVLNHVAREHPWAVAARSGDPKYRAYFYTFADRGEPDDYDRTVPSVFPDFAPGNFTWDDDLDAWVWTTFNSFQWDVNWSNPDVFVEYADIVLFLANAGVEVLRLDAIAFLWKRLGTNCQNQPEVHAMTQALHAVTRIACPALLFKAEAIVGPTDLVHYLGQGLHHGKVSDLAYHNGLMVQIWSMLAAGDVRLAAHALAALPPVPSTTAWITYLRCHDDIGWAIDDGDAAAVGLSGALHRAFLSDYYSGEFPGSSARGLVFQSNPATGDRRISGTAASLTGLEAGDERAMARMLLGYALVLGWGGVPVIWAGDELALTNDPDWASEPGHAGDNRWAHRPRITDDMMAGPAGAVVGRGADVRRPGRSRPRPGAAATSRRVGEQRDRAAGRPGRSCRCCDGIRSGRCSASTTSPLIGARSHARGWTSSAWSTRSTRSPRTPVVRSEDGNLWLAPYQALWIV